MQTALFYNGCILKGKDGFSMSYPRRALLYVTRKKTKSLLLLLVLLLITTLTLSGVAINAATQTAQLNVRQALGGVFTLQQNTSDPQKWISTNVGQYGSTSYYGGAPLTVELVEYIQSNVEGIVGCNATYTNYTVPVNADGDILKLIESEDDGGMSSLLAGYGDFNSTVSTYASTDTAYDSYFSGGYLELAQGRHFTAKDQNVAIISRELAELNQLSVGDQITLRMSSYKASMLGYKSEDTCVDVTIVGLFQATAKSTASLSNWSMENAIFTTLDVVRAARPDMGDESYEKIAFYVADPGQLDSIVEKVQALEKLDPSDFVVTVDKSSADAVTEPLENMHSLVSVLIVLVLAIGAVILYLVLSGRIKERSHESGVLLSIGLSRWNIAAQYLTEILLIAALAFPLSVFISGLIAQNVGDRLLDYALSDSTQPSSSADQSASKDGMYIGTSANYAPRFEGKTGMTKIEVAVSPASIAAMYAVGFLIICAAVLIASLPVLRMKPREIISKMS